MGNAFHQGGWGMYPTAVIVVVLVAAALRFAIRPDARREPLLRQLSLLSFVIGALGTVTGCIKAFTSLEDTTPIHYALIGLGEALNCVAFGICGVVLGGIFIAIGRAKLAAKPAAELQDPHGL
ncbi:MAG: MotA/TolQ/ExbB proton channel family protein [Deltaproteobacteria bacterium]|nr:MotA/TolQ/ExbB proton channel family protein [Deltaproteobacteria bacterium]